MYQSINNALNEVFLDGRFESRPLYLVLDNRSRSELAEILSVDPDEVEEYCCREVGKYFTRLGDPYSNFENDLWQWSLSGRKRLPPITALLFALSHAAEEMVSDGDFRASNYYERLAALVNVSSSRLSMFGKSTGPFWSSFNGWLANADFLFGRPTARAINANKWVSIAMSQAIVREVDRQRLHHMFEKYNFTNTDEVSESEIQQYISTWIRGTYPTRQFKEAWKKTELRPRVCEAAIAELKEWQGEDRASQDHGGSGISRLSLAIDFRHGLFERSVAVFFGSDRAIEPIDLATCDGTQLELSNTTFGGFATLEPRSSLDISQTMLGGLELSHDSKARFTWNGRAAIPFSQSDQGYWAEVSRVSHGIEHIVLVRDDKMIRAAIERALEEVAGPEYTLAKPDALKGLPSGWVLYENVKITKALQKLEGFESILSPVGESTSLRINGGVKLGRGIWHLWQPPIVHLEGEFDKVAITAWEGTAAEADAICQASSENNQVALDLSESIPESGNVYLEGSAESKLLASASILFRSANRARPLDRQSTNIVGYTGILSAEKMGDGHETLLCGLLVPPMPDAVVDLSILAEFQGLETTGPRPQNDIPNQRFEQQSGSLVRASTPDEFVKLPCAVRGRHYLLADAVPSGAPKHTPVEVRCRDCDVAFVHRGHRSRAGQAKNSKQKIRGVPPSRYAAAKVDRVELAMDLWLDGASFLGSGPSSVFETFAASGGVDTWRAGPALRDLSWLGHVDLQTGPAYRPRNWSVSPPSASFLGPNEAVFSGFRSIKFIKAITVAVEDQGGRLEKTRRRDHPEIVKVIGLGTLQLEQALKGVADPHGRSVAIVENAAFGILKFLAASKGLSSLFRPATLGSKLDMQLFDVFASRWRNVEHPDDAGAYRVSGAGNSYVYVTESRKAFSAPHEAVKLAAARHASIRLHAYDPVEKTFLSRLGCEPLGLLSRALVACSGELPEIADGLSKFGKVPAEVAAAVLQYLYQEELPK